MTKHEIAIITFSVWLIVISIFMLLAQSFNFEIFYVLSFIGFLIIIEVFATKYIQPNYLRYNRYILAAAIVIFGLIVAQKILEILGLEIFF